MELVDLCLFHFLGVWLKVTCMNYSLLVYRSVHFFVVFHDLYTFLVGPRRTSLTRYFRTYIYIV